MRKPKLLFFVTEDWRFCSHRLPLAIAAKDAGFDVSVLTRINDYEKIIKDAGLRIIPSSLSRRGLNPITEVNFIRNLIHIYREEKPDIVHHVAMKPVLYGSIAASLAGCKNVVNAITGMGSLFCSNKIKFKILRFFVLKAFRLLFNRDGSRLILQNPDDVEFFVQTGLVSYKKISLIRGAGVDTTRFLPSRVPSTKPTVILASRLLWDKGIKEFAEAAQKLHSDGIDARFILVGDSDFENPTAIPLYQIENWQKSGIIEWWGHYDDMPQVFSKAHIICLPSYREGLPKVLLEAASCGKPIVTTDVPGCREIVRHNKNGLLVSPKNSFALAEALKTLIQNPKKCLCMGTEGRRIVEQEFSQEIVIEQTLNLYRRMLS